MSNEMTLFNIKAWGRKHGIDTSRKRGDFWQRNFVNGKLKQSKYFNIFSKTVNIGWDWSQLFILINNKNFFSISFFGLFIEIA